MWSRPEVGRGGLQPDIDKVRSASHQSSSSGSCQSSQQGPWTLVKIQVVTTCHRPSLSFCIIHGKFWFPRLACPPHTEPSNVLSVGICLFEICIFVFTDPLSPYQLSTKYHENISNNAECLAAWVFYWLSNPRWARLCWVYQVPQ